MKKLLCLFVVTLMAAGTAFAQSQKVLLDDFEGPITAGPEGTVDFGAGNGSSCDVSASGEIKHTGNQSLKVVFDAVAGGYMWVARGFGLDAKNAGWIIKTGEIKWKDYSAFSFYIYGNDTKADIAFDIKDSGNELWRCMVTDDFKGWKQMICKFSDFSPRGDWQPDNADKNGQLDFPIKSFQFEPRPVAKGTLYFDTVELIKQ